MIEIKVVQVFSNIYGQRVVRDFLEFMIMPSDELAKRLRVSDFEVTKKFWAIDRSLSSDKWYIFMKHKDQ